MTGSISAELPTGQAGGSRLAVSGSSAAASTRSIVVFSCARQLRHQLRHPQQVVRGPHDVRPPSGAVDATVARLANAAVRLAPAPEFLDPLPTPLAHRVRGVAGGARINARATPARVLRHMRRDALDATPGHETLVVERLVSANGLRLQAARALALEEPERCCRFG